MYGEVVEGVDAERVRAGTQRVEDASGAPRATSSSRRTTCVDLVGRFKQIYETQTGRPFPADPHGSSCSEQCAPCSTPGTRRARGVYRQTYGIPDDLGTAVNVMQMVFGNRGEDCATGVCFSRDPSTGERGICGEFLVNAQGEDVVAGIRLPSALESMRPLFPAAFDRARADGRAARAALPRRAGHRVHGRARSAVPPADPLRQADRRGRACGPRSRWSRRDC